MGLPLLYILRHGETEWNVARRLQGALDSPLTAKGIAQAQKQREILSCHLDAPVTWITSPLGRARHSAAIVIEPHDAALIIDDRLREIEMGDWTGWTRARIHAARPDLADLAFYDAAPAGEGLAALTARLRLFLGDLGGPSVLITHGITSRVLRCLATGTDPAQFADIGGGQGIVYRVENGRQEILS